MGRALRALQRGDAASALVDLKTALGDPGFAEAADLADVRARAMVWYADALHRCGRAAEASEAVASAVLAARAVGASDVELAEVDALRVRIDHALETATRQPIRTRQATAAVDRPVQWYADHLRDSDQRAGGLLEKASAHADRGDVEGAAESIEAALGASASPRTTVIAALLMARLDPTRATEHIERAYREADASNDTGLIGAVAKAGEAAGVAVGRWPAGGH